MDEQAERKQYERLIEELVEAWAPRLRELAVRELNGIIRAQSEDQLREFALIKRGHLALIREV